MDAKAFLERFTDVSMDALHVIVGVVLFVGFAFLLRRPTTSFLPWVCVLIVAAANEVVDLMVERWPNTAEQVGEAAKDILLTMLLPTFLLIAARATPELFARRPNRSASAPSPDDRNRPKP